jgi:MazG family protein
MKAEKHFYPATAEGLVDILRALRSPEGCPWDRKQTYESLKNTLAEETAELLDAVDEGDPAHMREELGDVMMNLAFFAVIAEERGDFAFGDAMREINAKMIRRHPHVFADADAGTSDDVIEIWEAVKKQEGRSDRKSVLDGIPRSLSGLLQAEKLQRKVARYGFDWESPKQIVDKITEELQELKEAMAGGNDEEINEELGDLIFAAVNLVRFRKQGTSEDLLQKTIRKFSRRFRYLENKLAEQDISLDDASLDQMETLWQEAKRHGL